MPVYSYKNDEGRPRTTKDVQSAVAPQHGRLDRQSVQMSLSSPVQSCFVLGWPTSRRARISERQRGSDGGGAGHLLLLTAACVCRFVRVESSATELEHREIPRAMEV
ncbi:hypothetical protein V8C40DRAFT_235634 [Trichoderma camerunense]